MSFHALLIFFPLVFLTKEVLMQFLGKNSQQLFPPPGIKSLDILLRNEMLSIYESIYLSIYVSIYNGLRGGKTPLITCNPTLLTTYYFNNYRGLLTVHSF